MPTFEAGDTSQCGPRRVTQAACRAYSAAYHPRSLSTSRTSSKAVILSQTSRNPKSHSLAFLAGVSAQPLVLVSSVTPTLHPPCASDPAAMPGSKRGADTPLSDEPPAVASVEVPPVLGCVDRYVCMCVCVCMRACVRDDTA